MLITSDWEVMFKASNKFVKSEKVMEVDFRDSYKSLDMDIYCIYSQ